MLGGNIVEDDPEMIDEIHDLNGCHLGDNRGEIINDNERH